MMDFVGKRHWFFLGSAVALVIAVVALVGFGLKPGIDFAGGTSMTLHFEPQVEQTQLREAIWNAGHAEASVQRSEGDYLVRLSQLDVDEREALIQAIRTALDSEITVLDYNTVSPAVATETAEKAGLAVLIASAAMLLYIAWAFRRMPSPFKSVSYTHLTLPTN